LKTETQFQLDQKQGVTTNPRTNWDLHVPPAEQEIAAGAAGVASGLGLTAPTEPTAATSTILVQW